MDSGSTDEVGGVSGHVQQGKGARVDVIKRQRSFTEKLIGKCNACSVNVLIWLPEKHCNKSASVEFVKLVR